MHYIAAFGVTLVAIVFWVTSQQRSLALIDEKIHNAMAQIGLQIHTQGETLKCLLELINWYAASESETVMKTMIEAIPITKDSSPDDVKKQEKIIAEAISKVGNIAERYPELKRDESYIKVMDSVHQYEKMLQTSKLIYNDSAAKLNHAIRMFPTCMIAGILGFLNRRYFEEGG